MPEDVKKIMLNDEKIYIVPKTYTNKILKILYQTYKIMIKTFLKTKKKYAKNINYKKLATLFITSFWNKLLSENRKQVGHHLRFSSKF